MRYKPHDDAIRRASSIFLQFKPPIAIHSIKCWHLRFVPTTYVVKLGARPLNGRVFLINGMLLIMFDVLVPIEICAILFLSSSIPFSQAVERKQSFRLHQTTCFGFSGQPETNSSSHVFSRFLVRAAPPVLPRTF